MRIANSPPLLLDRVPNASLCITAKICRFFGPFLVYYYIDDNVKPQKMVTDF